MTSVSDVNGPAMLNNASYNASSLVSLVVHYFINRYQLSKIILLEHPNG